MAPVQEACCKWIKEKELAQWKLRSKGGKWNGRFTLEEMEIKINVLL